MNGWQDPTWRRICLLILALFCVRGLFVLCFYPPLEGFDEFQHIAYIHYVNENRAVPRFEEALFPASLIPDTVASPHPKILLPQTGPMGGLSYNKFYGRTPVPDPSAQVMLFQAQHPPVYYILMSPLYGWARHALGFLQTVYLLRALNIVMGGIALILFLLPLRRALGSCARAGAAALMISMVPMYLVYVLRVSNDALAVLISAVNFTLILSVRDEKNLAIKAAAIGLLIGIGSLTKMIAFLLLPAICGYLFFLALVRVISWQRGALAVFIIIGLYLVVCLPYHIDNYARLGTAFPALETIVNHRNGKTAADLLAAIHLRHLWTFFLLTLVQKNLWTSGMTFIYPPMPVLWTWFGLVMVSFGGALAAVRRRGIEPWTAHFMVLCGLVVTFTFLGAYAHGLNCQLAWGKINTPSYYVMVAFPAFLSLAMLALSGYGSAVLDRVVPAALIAVFAATEIGALLFQAVPLWTNSRDAGEMYERLALIHPAFPAPAQAIPLLLLAAAIFIRIAQRMRQADPAPQTS